VGALVALPALRLSGIYLALATAAFAVILDQWIFQLPAFSVFGHHFDLFEAGSLSVPRPRLFGLRFEGQKAEFVLMATAFALSAMIVVAIRRSQFGYRLLAMKDSPAACATLGLNLTRTKLAVFSLSAALAGFGGAMYGGALRVTSSQQFDFFTGLPMLLLMVVAGIATVGGALACGISLGSPVLTNLFPHLTELTLVLAGLAGIGMARNPNGFVLELRQRWHPMLDRPLVGMAVGAALLAAWLLRIEHVLTSWPYVGISLAVVVSVPAISLLTGRAAPAGVDEVPLEWVGISRPYRPGDVIMLDRALALREPGPHGAA